MVCSINWWITKEVVLIMTVFLGMIDIGELQPSLFRQGFQDRRGSPGAIHRGRSRDPGGRFGRPSDSGPVGSKQQLGSNRRRHTNQRFPGVPPQQDSMSQRSSLGQISRQVGGARQMGGRQTPTFLNNQLFNRGGQTSMITSPSLNERNGVLGRVGTDGQGLGRSDHRGQRFLGQGPAPARQQMTPLGPFSAQVRPGSNSEPPSDSMPRATGNTGNQVQSVMETHIDNQGQRHLNNQFSPLSLRGGRLQSRSFGRDSQGENSNPFLTPASAGSAENVNSGMSHRDGTNPNHNPFEQTPARRDNGQHISVSRDSGTNRDTQFISAHQPSRTIHSKVDITAPGQRASIERFRNKGQTPTGIEEMESVSERKITNTHGVLSSGSKAKQSGTSVSVDTSSGIVSSNSFKTRSQQRSQESGGVRQFSHSSEFSFGQSASSLNQGPSTSNLGGFEVPLRLNNQDQSPFEIPTPVNIHRSGNKGPEKTNHIISNLPHSTFGGLSNPVDKGAPTGDIFLPNIKESPIFPTQKQQTHENNNAQDAVPPSNDYIGSPTFPFPVMSPFKKNLTNEPSREVFKKATIVSHVSSVDQPSLPLVASKTKSVQKKEVHSDGGTKVIPSNGHSVEAVNKHDPMNTQQQLNHLFESMIPRPPVPPFGPPHPPRELPPMAQLPRELPPMGQPPLELPSMEQPPRELPPPKGQPPWELLSMGQPPRELPPPMAHLRRELPPSMGQPPRELPPPMAHLRRELPPSMGQPPRELPPPMGQPPRELPSMGQPPRELPPPMGQPPWELPSMGQPPQELPLPMTQLRRELPSMGRPPRELPPLMGQPPRELPSVGQLPRQLPPMGQPPRDLPSMGQPLREQPLIGQPTRELPPPKGQPPRELPSMGQPPRELPPPMGQPPWELPSMGQPPQELPLPMAQLRRELPSMGRPPWELPPLMGQPPRELPSVGQLPRELPPMGQPPRDLPSMGQPLWEQPLIGQPTRELPPSIGQPPRELPPSMGHPQRELSSMGQLPRELQPMGQLPRERLSMGQPPRELLTMGQLPRELPPMRQPPMELPPMEQPPAMPAQPAVIPIESPQMWILESPPSPQIPGPSRPLLNFPQGNLPTPVILKQQQGPDIVSNPFQQSSPVARQSNPSFIVPAGRFRVGEIIPASEQRTDPGLTPTSIQRQTGQAVGLTNPSDNFITLPQGPSIERSRQSVGEMGRNTHNGHDQVSSSVRTNRIIESGANVIDKANDPFATGSSTSSFQEQNATTEPRKESQDIEAVLKDLGLGDLLPTFDLNSPASAVSPDKTGTGTDTIKPKLDHETAATLRDIGLGSLIQESSRTVVVTVLAPLKGGPANDGVNMNSNYDGMKIEPPTVVDPVVSDTSEPALSSIKIKEVVTEPVPNIKDAGFLDEAKPKNQAHFRGYIPPKTSVRELQKTVASCPSCVISTTLGKQTMSSNGTSPDHTHHTGQTYFIVKIPKAQPVSKHRLSFSTIPESVDSFDSINTFATEPVKPVDGITEVNIQSRIGQIHDHKKLTESSPEPAGTLGEGSSFKIGHINDRTQPHKKTDVRIVSQQRPVIFPSLSKVLGTNTTRERITDQPLERTVGSTNNVERAPSQPQDVARTTGEVRPSPKPFALVSGSGHVTGESNDHRGLHHPMPVNTSPHASQRIRLPHSINGRSNIYPNVITLPATQGRGDNSVHRPIQPVRPWNNGNYNGQWRNAGSGGQLRQPGRYRENSNPRIRNALAEQRRMQRYLQSRGMPMFDGRFPFMETNTVQQSNFGNTFYPNENFDRRRIGISTGPRSGGYPVLGGMAPVPWPSPQMPPRAVGGFF